MTTFRQRQQLADLVEHALTENDHADTNTHTLALAVCVAIVERFEFYERTGPVYAAQAIGDPIAWVVEREYGLCLLYRDATPRSDYVDVDESVQRRAVPLVPVGGVGIDAPPARLTPPQTVLEEAWETLDDLARRFVAAVARRLRGGAA